MLVLGPQIASLLFGYGHSSPSAIMLLGAVVATFGVALVPFTGYTILQRGFYALQDTKTPALITAAVTVVGVAGCLASTWVLPRADIVIGIPLAYALAYTVGLVADVVILRRRLGRIDGHRLLRTHAQVAVAAGLAGSIGAVSAYALSPSTGSALLTLFVAGGVGALAYVAVARLVRLTELRQLAAVALAGVR
jgi:putative peptidoglycan lipid II flippase